jgi:hypothetical protein
MTVGVKPRSREAVRLLAQGFTQDDRPGEDEWWPRFLMIVIVGLILFRYTKAHVA